MIELDVIDDLVNNTKKLFRGYQFKQYGNNKPTAVIIGENHSESFRKTSGRCFQENLIRNLKPKYVLIETLSELNENNICFRHWREKYQCELRPCDLSESEKESVIREILNNHPNLLQELENCYNALEVIEYFEHCMSLCPDLERPYYDAREIKMGEIILNFSKEPTELVIAIIGNWHARRDSEIHETLNGHINYVCIWNDEIVEKLRIDKLRRD